MLCTYFIFIIDMMLHFKTKSRLAGLRLGPETSALNQLLFCFLWTGLRRGAAQTKPQLRVKVAGQISSRCGGLPCLSSTSEAVLQTWPGKGRAKGATMGPRESEFRPHQKRPSYTFLARKWKGRFENDRHPKVQRRSFCQAKREIPPITKVSSWVYLLQGGDLDSSESAEPPRAAWICWLAGMIARSRDALSHRKRCIKLKERIRCVGDPHPLENRIWGGGGG